MAPRRDVRRSSVLADLVALTKPRVISLLLVTTIAPMFATGGGLPRWSLVESTPLQSRSARGPPSAAARESEC